MDIHPILEEWLDHWVWPTPFKGPGVDFRMRITKERCIPMWNRIVIRALEGAKANEESYNSGDYSVALGGYSAEGPRMSMNQMSTQLLSVPIAQQEEYLDLLRMRARQLWDEVKHGSLHGDVLIRGGHVDAENDLMDEARANFGGSRGYFGLTATFPLIHPLARAAQNYHTEAGACLGIRCSLEVNSHPLSIHENLSQHYEEMMHFIEGKYQMDMFCLTPEDQRPVEEALDFLLWPPFIESRGVIPEDTANAYSPVRCKKTGDVPLADVVGLWPGHGNRNACFALTRDGRLRAVGQNAWGKLGVDDGLNNQNLFTEVAGLPGTSRVLKVAPCGSSSSAATAVHLKDGSIWTAGSGGYGFHGDGTTDDRHGFEQLPLPSGVGAALDLWAGGEYAQLWFTGDDGNTYACGLNNVGQLGIGNTTVTSTPTRVALPDGVTARMISTGGAFGGANHRHSTIMLGTDDRVYSCGNFGQYGAWGVGQTATPLQWPLPMPPDQWHPVEVVAHSYTSQVGFFVRLADGAVWAAGRNYYNKLGVEGSGHAPTVMARVELY